MKEKEWLACDSPLKLLEVIQNGDDLARRLNAEPGNLVSINAAQWLYPLLSDRRLRLWACACARTVWDCLTHTTRRAVERAELYADGKASLYALQHAASDAYKSSHVYGKLPVRTMCDLGWACCCNGVDWRSYIVHHITRHSKPRPLASVQAALLREIVGNPFQPVIQTRAFGGLMRVEWLTDRALAIAQTIYLERKFELLGILGDAIEDAGCTEQHLLDHLRSPGPHALGCWALDLVLGKN